MAGRGVSHEGVLLTAVNKQVFVALVLVHLGVVGVHSAAHVALGIVPGTVDSAFIVGVIVAGPLVAALVLRSRPTLGLALLGAFLLASFAYGIDNHFLTTGPDRLSVLMSEPWTGVFVVTAVALAALEIVGGLLALTVAALRIRIPSGPARPPA